MDTVRRHTWIVGPTRAARRLALAGPQAPHLVVGCHQRLRGPYTGTGPVLRTFVPDAFRRWPDLVEAHRVELLYTIPELSADIGPEPESLVGSTPFDERTRYFGQQWIRGMSQGVVTFLVEYARRRAAEGVDGGPLRLAFDDVDAAERTEQELLALLVRRADPATLHLALGSRADRLPAELAAGLRTYAERSDLPADLPAPGPQRTAADLARAYVRSDGTSDDPAELAAYQAADPATLARLHDERAAELAPGADWGTRLGALPYHLEHGCDPRGAGRRALREALDYCVATGYSAATVDFGMRGRAVCDVADQQDYCHFTAKAASALVPMGRVEECEELYRELRRLYPLPRVQMTGSYAIAMLHTRFYQPRDHESALEQSNNARALASLETDPVFGPYIRVYQDNGLALIEMHRGNLERALSLVSEGIATLDRELPADRYLVHRSQLLHNKARVLVALGRLDEAYADFTRLIAWDPYYVEYHTDRGNLSRRRGDLVAALADYDRAIEVAAPFHELFYNRAQLRLSLGQPDGALADLTYLLEMEPDHLEARVSRATLLLSMDPADPADPAGTADPAVPADPADPAVPAGTAGTAGTAEDDVRLGLALAPEEPRLLCLLGRIEQERGSDAQAAAAFDQALRADPAFAPALVDRATLAYARGELRAAAADLTAALNVLGEDPDVLYNRGVVYQESGRFREALADFDRAAAGTVDDPTELLARRAECAAALDRVGSVA
jgi:tetratricopeptide (TPR) repeat protein